MDEKLKLKANMKEEEVDPMLYYNIVEKCFYVIQTCLNIQFAIKFVNWIITSHQQSHLFVKKKILCSIKSTQDYRIYY